jgi:hypothetical protein
LKARWQPSWRLSDSERLTLAEIGSRLGRQGLQPVARLAKPDTISRLVSHTGWLRSLPAAHRAARGRPRTSPEIEALVVRWARQNSGWGYDRMVRALANLGHPVTDQTMGNILRQHGIGPVPQQSKTTTWKDLIRRHWTCSQPLTFSPTRC